MIGGKTMAERQVEILGLVTTRYNSESHAGTGTAIDPAYTAALALAHEHAGFDRVLIGYGSSAPDGFQVAAYAAAKTERLGFLLAHRPGFVAPTLAARQLATLDQFSGGRLAVHIISGGSDAEQRRDGDFIGKDDRYARTDEYIALLRQSWTAREPFDHAGDWYRVEQGWSDVRPVAGTLPIFFGGLSDAAIAVGAKRADTYALFAEPVEEVRALIARIRDAARAAGRTDGPRFSLSLRPILGRTEQEAWNRADHILADARALRERAGAKPGLTSEAVSARRLSDAAARGSVLDKRLWTGIAGLAPGLGNTTALVGTVDQVVDSLLDYADLGIDTFLLRGFDPIEDAVAYGRTLIPALRAGVAARIAA
jgi:alkanesulfonate monooxygenase